MEKKSPVKNKKTEFDPRIFGVLGQMWLMPVFLQHREGSGKFSEKKLGNGEAADTRHRKWP